MGYCIYVWCILSSPCSVIHCVSFNMLNWTASIIITERTHNTHTDNMEYPWSTICKSNVYILSTCCILAYDLISFDYIKNNYTTPQDIPENLRQPYPGNSSPSYGAWMSTSSPVWIGSFLRPTAKSSFTSYAAVSTPGVVLIIPLSWIRAWCCVSL